MSRFKKKKGSKQQAINTASLPDIIFMLLFFFMVTTVMREVTLIVQIKAPEAAAVEKLEKKSLVSYIYVGIPQKSKIYGTESRIQLNDAFATVDDIQDFIIRERESRDEADKKFLTTSIKADENTRMGIITDIKQELRKIGAFKINYSSRKIYADN
ncbi:MAG: biopolymer transporter ExbD [Bacteroidetes bacterium]|nr:biopolymer transporter ExbD [Bacteroidota bacterium]